MKRRFSIDKFITAGLCVCCAYVLACCIVTGSYNKNQLLQAGRIFSFSEHILHQEGEGIHYVKERKCMQVTEDNAVIVLDEMKVAKLWKYLFVKIGSCSADSIPVRIDCYNKDNAVFYTSESQFLAGDNYVTLDSAQACKMIALQLQDAKGTELTVETIQLRIKLPTSAKKIAWITVLCSIVFYFVATKLLSLSGAKSFGKACGIYLFQSVKDILEYIYTELGNHLYLKVKDSRWYANRNYLRIFLFALLGFWQCIALKSGIYTRAKSYRYCVLVFCVMIFLTAVLLIGDRAADPVKERKRSWLWTAFWLGTCISDIVVDKYYRYTGCVMLLIVGFFLYWWKQMEHPEDLVKNMVSGFRASFVLVFAYCFVYRQSMTVYALFMLFIFGACFIQNKRWWDGIGILLSAFLIYRGMMQSFAEGSHVITQSFYEQSVIWSGYIRKLNCFGHKRRMLNFRGQKWYPANGILEIVFRYGIFVGVFYIGMLWQSGKMLIAQCRKRQQNTEFRVFSIGAAAVFLITNLLLSLEAPFLSPVWVVFYLFSGLGTEKH